MSRLEVPLQHRKLWATGDVPLRAELDLLLKDNAGQWRADTFLVDSGTEMTTMPAWLAKKIDLPMLLPGRPGCSPSRSQAATLPRKLLGLSDVVDTMRFLFDGAPTPTPSARFGNLILETL